MEDSTAAMDRDDIRAAKRAAALRDKEATRSLRAEYQWKHSETAQWLRERADRRDHRKRHRTCFWTWRWGHMAVDNLYGGGHCEICGKGLKSGNQKFDATLRLGIILGDVASLGGCFALGTGASGGGGFVTAFVGISFAAACGLMLIARHV